MRRRTRQGFTLIELVVAMGLLAILASVAYASYAGLQRRSADDTAIALADQVADNFQHYSGFEGTFPLGTQAQDWSAVVTALGADAEFPSTPPAMFKTNASDSTGSLINAYTDAGGSTFQIVFKSATGTGTVFCKDANGYASVAGSSLGQDGPWTGCP